jgi:adenine-specific DNA-methyltransferase
MSDALSVAIPLELPDLEAKEHIGVQTTSPHPGYYNLQNRRFLGNKYKLIAFIQKIVKEEVGSYSSVCDLFAGTGVVGAAFNSPGTKIISNDILLSSYVSLKAFIGATKLNTSSLEKKIAHLNTLRAKPNYFSEHFADSFFTYENASLIGTIREEIDLISRTEEEKYALLSSLLYAADKVANTVGHYDTYRKDMTSVQKIKLRCPDLPLKTNRGNQVFREDANNLVRKVQADILYLDPPYNSRQYSDAYHLLENLAAWEKPEVAGKAKKMDRTHIKSRYSLKTATEAMRDLIENANAKHILISYNNTGDSKHGRSNARITDKDMISILKAKGEVKVFEQQYRAFTTGRSSALGNAERVFYCKVK